jgi:VWFA-related protein
MLTRSGLSQLTLCSTSSLFAIAVAIGFSAAALPTQSNPPQTQSAIPVIRANTRAVAVDVVVTKGQDQPVGGLHKQDFQLLEDGKPVTVDFFEEHTARTLPPGALPALAKMPPNVYTNVPPAPESDSVNVLLLDTLNTDRQDQAYVHQQMVNFLKTMQPGLRVAVFVLGSKLRMVQGFTTDSSVLRDAVNDKKNGVKMEADTSVTRSLQDKLDDLEDKAMLASMGISTAGLEALGTLQANFSGYQADQRAAMTLQALNYLGRYLAAVPGRKNLIWFASSFPVTIFPSPKEKQSFGQIREYSAALKETADLLTVSKVAVYPIGAEGMIVSHVCEPNSEIHLTGCVDVEGGEVSSHSGPAPSGRPTDLMTPFTNENAARADKIMAMEQLAADTGGKAFYNTNDLNAAMMHAIEHGAHYYTLVYTPANKKMDGSYRRIEVKTSAGKYNLAYRHGYNADNMDKSRKSATSSVIQSANASAANPDGKTDPTPLRQLMARGMPSSTQIIYGLRVLPATPQPEPTAIRAGYNPKLPSPTTRYTADFLIDWKKVQLQPAQDGTHTGMIRVELLAYDRDGNPLNWTGQTMGLTLDAKTYAAIQHSGIPAHLEIDLPNTDVYLSTGIYDLQANKAGTLEIPLKKNVTTQAAGSTTTLPPGR